MKAEDRLDAIGNLLGQILDQKPPNELISFFHATLMRRRCEPNPSKNDFELGRTIAYGISLGFLFAKQYPIVTKEEIISAVQEGIKKVEKGAN